MSLTTITSRFIRNGAVLLSKLGALTTKGDTLVHDGTDHQRLGVGTDGHVLTAASAEANGVKWAEVPAGDHGGLSGLADDDHTQYHNDTRGDARYYTQGDLDTALAGKSDTSHTHTESDITDLDKYTQAETDTLLSGKSDTGHTHTEADITDLDKYSQATLDGAFAAVDAEIADKADAVHTHTESDITDLDKYTQAEADALLANKSDTGHTHDLDDITDSGALAALDTVDTGQIDDAAVTLAKLGGLTTKGDLLAFAAAHARLAVGTDGQVLTADSAEAAGIKWADAAGGGGGEAGESSLVSISSAGAQSAASGAVFFMVFDTEVYDTDGFADLATNNTRLTVPTGLGGVYLIVGAFRYGGDTLGIRYFRLFLNGSFEFQVIQNPASNGGAFNGGYSYVASLAAGDYIELGGLQNSGSSLVVNDARFAITRIGPTP